MIYTLVFGVVAVLCLVAKKTLFTLKVLHEFANLPDDKAYRPLSHSRHVCLHLGTKVSIGRYSLSKCKFRVIVEGGYVNVVQNLVNGKTIRLNSFDKSNDLYPRWCESAVRVASVHLIKDKCENDWNNLLEG